MNIFLTAQLEEVLDPYLPDTNIGLPYWDWTKDSSVPDVWEDIPSPIKNHTSEDYNWSGWKWHEMLNVCQTHEPLSGPQTHALRIRKKDFERVKKEEFEKHAKGEQKDYLRDKDPFSRILSDEINKALLEKSYKGFDSKIRYGHNEIHNTLKCTTSYTASTAYGLRYVI